jgi:diacylglycerol kinase
MNNNKPFSLNSRIKSFGYALTGIKLFFKTQHNAWIHALAAAIVITLGFVLKVNMNEWCWLIAAIALVVVSEMLNTAIEFFTDLISPDFHLQAAKIKDVAAGAVLISAIAAASIGMIVFLPKLL